MATQVPASLKSADLNRFVHRAAQLEKPKPIIAYWCEYWIVNQILSKGLHNADQESLVFTTTLMDKLEQFKLQHAQEPAVTDDVVGKAYVEQFGLETFERADNAVRANKASRQTADTFQASATFLDLLQIWGSLEPEVAAKIKFAKYHALRIAKALKAGEDPNLSNPAQPTPAEENLPPLDPNDAEVQALEGAGPASARQPSVVEIPDETDRVQNRLAQRSMLDESLHPSRDTSVPPAAAQQPSVSEVPDEAHRFQSSLANQSSIDQSLHPSRAPSVPPSGDVSPLPQQDAAAFYTGQTTEPVDISPLDPPNDRKGSLGGNYFPVVPSSAADSDLPSAPTTTGDAPPDLPSAPTHLGKVNTDLPFAPSEPSVTSMSARSELGAALNQPPGRHSPPLPPHRHGTLLSPSSPAQTAQFPSTTQPPAIQPQQPLNPGHPRPAHGPTPPIPQQQHRQTSLNTSIPASIPQTMQPYAHDRVAPPPQPVATEINEEAVMKAQKHARWAISALNFEDIPTAIRELRGALASLGAT